MTQNDTLDDFSKADYTAVVSDLHLCEEEPVNIKFPLWKKYKTRQFFFDEDFFDFLKHIDKKSEGKPIELVLNGDIFDFDSVTGLPLFPIYKMSWLEQKRGLRPQEEKSVFKIQRILKDHATWLLGLRWFVERGHRLVFVVGNHDLELHFPAVQEAVREALCLASHLQNQVRFCEWFYISNGDTLIEHGNQYDPYCVAQDPIHPFVQNYNQIEVRIPFGNLATRYLVNGMGFFNPHADSNFIMSAKEYVQFFLVYMLRAQPFIIFSWLWGATVTLVQSFLDRLKAPIKDPMAVEDRIDEIAKKANATPRAVRELKELFVSPAASNPILIARELWLDRAFLVLIALIIVFQIFVLINSWFPFSIFWVFVPISLFFPFFLFYSKSINSEAATFKEPDDKILSLSSAITKVSRVVYGHTHIARHEIIGAVEHLNSGTWSPAFLDVECEKPLDEKTYVWLGAQKDGRRIAQLYRFKSGRDSEFSTTTERAKSLV